MVNKTIKVTKKHKVFVFIFLLSLFLRLYRIDTLTTFGRDQGIDFLAVYDIIQNKNLTLLGIKTSVGEFFQGPLLRYLLVPGFYLFNFDPIAGAYTAVFISQMGLLALYLMVVKFFDKKVALFSTALFAVSPELVKFGNTPLYQHFVPLFLILSLFFFLYYFKKKDWRIIFLAGVFAGLSFELHYLVITYTISVFIYLFLYSKKRALSNLNFLAGNIVGILPTIIFELRHDFLNTNLVIDHLKNLGGSGQSQNFAGIWLEGAGRFLIANSLVFGGATLLLILYLIFTGIKKYNPRKPKGAFVYLSLILLLILFSLSFIYPSFLPHYALPFWLLALILFPFLFTESFSNKVSKAILSIFILANLLTVTQSLGQNHGYNMPLGWSYKKIVEVGDIISSDSKSYENFNVASLLDGDTRTYPVRYTLTAKETPPSAVDAYPRNDILYLVAYEYQDFNNSNVWEIVSMRPFRVGKGWEIGNNIYLYRIERVKNEQI